MIHLTLTPLQFAYVQRAIENDLEDIGDLAAFGVEDAESDLHVARTVLAKIRDMEQTEVVPF